MGRTRTQKMAQQAEVKNGGTKMARIPNTACWGKLTSRSKRGSGNVLFQSVNIITQ